MHTKIISLTLIILFSVSSCQLTNTEEGIGYSEYINEKDLVESVVDSYPNGDPRAIIYTIKDDVEQNTVKEIHFFEDGKIQVEGTLKNKQRHGIWTFYHENGKVWSTGEFEMGKSVGLFEIYNKEGIIKIKSYYKDNKKIKEEYFSKGKLKKTVDL